MTPHRRPNTKTGMKLPIDISAVNPKTFKLIVLEVKGVELQLSRLKKSQAGSISIIDLNHWANGGQCFSAFLIRENYTCWYDIDVSMSILKILKL